MFRLTTEHCLQDFIICGPEKETCVANQTLKDEKCFVPCEGLYADIADDSLNLNVLKGKGRSSCNHPLIYVRFPYCFARVRGFI